MHSDKITHMIRQYIKEMKQQKFNIAVISLILISSYSIYLYLNQDKISTLGEEDHLFEWATAIFLAISSVFFFLTFITTKNIFILALSLTMFFGSGEEISWGQRIFDFATPETIKKINVQQEFTLHNINIFNHTDLKGHTKQGIERLTDINFMFKAFTMLFGILLPLGVYHLKMVSKFAMKIKLPVPPISIGIFFIINWLTYYFLQSYLLPTGMNIQYYDTNYEIMECISTLVLFFISLYFYVMRNTEVLGRDIKQTI